MDHLASTSHNQAVWLLITKAALGAISIAMNIKKTALDIALSLGFPPTNTAGVSLDDSRCAKCKEADAEH